MGNDFVRSTKDVKDASKQRLDNMKQNDMVSDSEDIYIHNHFELFPITKSLLSVTSDDSITVKKTGKNIRNLRINEEWLQDKVAEYAPEVGDAPVTSVNGETGDVVIDVPEVPELPKYEKQILRDDVDQYFKTNGYMFRYREFIPQSEIVALTGDYEIVLNEINNVRDKHDNGESANLSIIRVNRTIPRINWEVNTLTVKIILDNDGLRLLIMKYGLEKLELSEDESIIIDFTGILDFEKPL